MKKLKLEEKNSWTFQKRNKNVKKINFGLNSFDVSSVPKVKTVDSCMNVCSKCLSIFTTSKALTNHFNICSFSFTSFYEENNLKFAKVISTSKKQILSILGDSLITKKTNYIDISNFDYYIIFNKEVKGYFSRNSKNDNSLSCIVIFPPFQKEGLGSLLIDFSQAFYHSSQIIKEAETINDKLYVPNGPERPLSGAGTFCYRKYWQYKVIGAKTINQIAEEENLSVEDAVIGLERNGFNFKTWKLEKAIVINKPKRLLSKKLRIIS